MSEQLQRLQQAQQARREMLAQWRSGQLTELSLPSGLTVWVKDVSMIDLMLTGRLPDGVLDFAQQASQDGKMEIDLKAVARTGPGFREMLDALVLLCVVEPPIAERGDEEHLGLNEIGGDDKMHIFNWANREVEKLRPFREGEDEPVAAVQPEHGIFQEAE